MQASPYISYCTKGTFKNHFTKANVNGHLFRNLWHPRFSNLNLRDFQLWGHLKYLVGNYDKEKTLPDPKKRHLIAYSFHFLHANLPIISTASKTKFK